MTCRLASSRRWWFDPVAVDEQDPLEPVVASERDADVDDVVDERAPVDRDPARKIHVVGRQP